jgi:hypothetical protein
MASWLAAWLVSGRFEPYDSDSGWVANQLVIGVPLVMLAGLRGWRPVGWLLAGVYLGMNAYACLFGGSESRAWAGLGAITSLLLLVGDPGVAAAPGVAGVPVNLRDQGPPGHAWPRGIPQLAAPMARARRARASRSRRFGSGAVPA